METKQYPMCPACASEAWSQKHSNCIRCGFRKAPVESNSNGTARDPKTPDSMKKEQ